MFQQSAPTASQSDQRQTREPRPPYSQEEIIFVWYRRTDLAQDWEHVVRDFNLQFPRRGQRNKGGLQCRFYRTLGIYHVAKVREQTRRKNQGYVGEFGVVERTNLRFGWMEPRHQNVLPLPQFRTDCRRDFRDSPCGQCDHCRGC